MGGFTNVLGHAAAGFEQARQIDQQRQFEDAQARRRQHLEVLGKLASDESLHPDLRNWAMQEALTGAQAPYDKKWEPGYKNMPAPPAGGGRQIQQPTQSFTPPAPMPTPPTGLGMTGPSIPQMPTTAEFTPPAQPEYEGYIKSHAAQMQEAAQAAQTMNDMLMGGQVIRQEPGGGYSTVPISKSGHAMPAIPGTVPTAALSGQMSQDKMTAAQARQNGIPIDDSIKDDDWVQAKYNRLGQAVGWHVTAAPSAYAPTERTRIMQVPQADNSIKAVAVTETSQKRAPGSKAAPTAGVQPGGQIIGKRPKTQLMVVPTPQGPQVIEAHAGQKVPVGAVTPTQYGKSVMPTGATQSRSEFAIGLIPNVDRTTALITHAAPKLGALKGRWNEFIAGRLGGGLDDDPEISALRTDVGLLQTGMMVPHVGARGGVQLIAKFKGMIDSGKASAPQLNASLGEMRKFLVTYANEGRIKGWGDLPYDAPGDFSVIAPNGKPYTFKDRESLDKFKAAAGIK